MNDHEFAWFRPANAFVCGNCGGSAIESPTSSCLVTESTIAERLAEIGITRFDQIKPVRSAECPVTESWP